MALINQNLSNYTTQDFSPIPPGEYDFVVNDSDVVNTKSGKRMIKLTCCVLGPTYVGRIIFENFLLDNDIAMARLKTLATVSNHPRPDYIQDTQELHGLKFRGNVGIRENEGYSPQNVIKTFKRIPAPQEQATSSFPTPAVPSAPNPALPSTVLPLPLPQARAQKPQAPWIK